MFTWRHLLWLVICAGLIWAAVHAFDKKRPGLDRVLTTALIAAVISEIVKMAGVIELVPSQNGELLLPYLPMNHLPLHFCSLQIILIAAAKFMKNEKRRETLLAFMAPTCVLGGILALLMPSIFTTTIPVEKAFTSPVSYQFFFFHSMIIALGLIIVRSGRIDWSMKNFRDTTLLVYLLGFISIYLNSVLASPSYADGRLVSVDFWTNFFFTYQNPLGIRITQLWQWYLYLLIIALLAALLLYLFHLPLIRRKNR
ncbi:MAG: YwaF family protein [Mogibacterium sp.]|nr:YwaF family protein [Mogibacterium sp.]